MFAPWEHDAPSKLPPLSSDTDTFSQYGSNEVSGMSRNTMSYNTEKIVILKQCTIFASKARINIF